MLDNFNNFGWIPSKPDFRNYTVNTPEIQQILRHNKVIKKSSYVDLRKFCSPIENQGHLGSCTSMAAAGIVEYYEKRRKGTHINCSKLFIYKVTRNLMQTTGDTGGTIKKAMQALVLCGAPDEKYWPYEIEKFDIEPPSFIYNIADNYEATSYFCLDPNIYKANGDRVLIKLKHNLAKGIPAMFGFYGFDSFNQGDSPGNIPYPSKSEKIKWGHAVVAVGYDDNKIIYNKQTKKATKGAIIIRNSWGKSWGDEGYGYLPYDYIKNRLAVDFWSLLSMKWVKFKFD